MALAIRPYLLGNSELPSEWSFSVQSPQFARLIIYFLTSQKSTKIRKTKLRRGQIWIVWQLSVAKRMELFSSKCSICWGFISRTSQKSTKIRKTKLRRGQIWIVWQLSVAERSIFRKISFFFRILFEYKKIFAEHSGYFLPNVPNIFCRTFQIFFAERSKYFLPNDPNIFCRTINKHPLSPLQNHPKSYALNTLFFWMIQTELLKTLWEKTSMTQTPVQNHSMGQVQKNQWNRQNKITPSNNPQKPDISKSTVYLRNDP